VFSAAETANRANALSFPLADLIIAQFGCLFFGNTTHFAVVVARL
jgi:hypothetical protein